MSMPCMPCHGTELRIGWAGNFPGNQQAPGSSPICLSGFEGRYCRFEASGRSVDLKVYPGLQRPLTRGASFLVSVTFWLESHKRLRF